MHNNRPLRIITLFIALAVPVVPDSAVSTVVRAGDAKIAATASGYTSAAEQGYPVVDTGQRGFYDDHRQISRPAEGDAFYGQDAQFDGNQPGYRIGADGLTVHDLVTGLTWTRSPDLNGDGTIDLDDKLTYDAALVHAQNRLNPRRFGGYGDWRLPTIKELYSLVNFDGTDPDPFAPSGVGLRPFIDTRYFAFGYGDVAAGERIIDAQFWSSDRYAGRVFGRQPAAFGLNLADGRIKGYPTGGRVTKLNYVYFVRGNTGYGINRFTDNGDGTVSDLASGLMWSKADSGNGIETGPRSGMSWKGALAWVRQRNDDRYLGYDDWRLPNAKELQSIVDYSRAPAVTGSAAIDPVFDITRISNEKGWPDYPWFWTGTTHLRSNGDASGAVYLSFGRAMGHAHGAWRDVHGAGAQRSDRKSGDFRRFAYRPDGYYFAPSPQGDAARIYNYVRLVRGGYTSG